MNGIVLSHNLLQMFDQDVVNSIIRTFDKQPAVKNVKSLAKQTFIYRLFSAPCY